MRIFRNPLLPLLLALFGTVPAGAESLPIVEKAIALHGGTTYEKSTAELNLCSKSGCFSVRSTVNGGLFEHEVSGQVRAGERRVRITNNTVQAWLDGKLVEIPPQQEQGYRDWVMARVYFCFLPYRLGDDSVSMEDQGLEGWGDQQLHRVKVTFAEGSSTDADDEYVYWFDPETGRLEQFAYSYAGNPGGLRFRQLHNYREVGGLLFFDQKNLGAEGAGLSVDVITPEFVESRLRLVSEVRLEEIQVEEVGQ